MRKPGAIEQVRTCAGRDPSGRLTSIWSFIPPALLYARLHALNAPRTLTILRRPLMIVQV